jgi:selenide,water dikinase
VPQKTLFNYLKDIGDGSIGRDTPDCSVSVVEDDSSLVQVSTTDFFYPLVLDPYKQGEIALCNVVSDLYAMGITRIDNILMVMCVSLKMNEKQREVITKEMMRGFNDKAMQAGCKVTGGQTVMNPWPMIGGTAISVLKRNEVIFPNNAQPTDLILLTKPLGTQVSANLIQWIITNDKRWEKSKTLITEDEAWKSYHVAQESMARLNLNPAKLMHKYRVGACTDVTGFGLKGHCENLAVAQKAELKFVINKLPIIDKMVLLNNPEIRNFKLTEGYSAETSGGLLIIIKKDDAESFREDMLALNEWCWIIGEVVEGNREVVITEDVEVINVN